MEAKQMKSLLSKIAPKKPSLHILTYGRIHGGKLHVTDLDDHIVIDVDAPDGMLDISQFLKTLDLSGSLAEGINPDEYPQLPQFRESSPISESVFNSVDLRGFAFHAAEDETRACLCGIHINTAGYVEATNGHTMRRLSCATPAENSLIVNPRLGDVLALLPAVENAWWGTNTLVKTDECKDPIPYGGEYVRLVGDGFMYYHKLIDGPYPDVNKVIRKTSREMIFSAPQAAFILAAVERLLPYTNEKTRLIRFENSGVRVVNYDTGKNLYIELPFTLTPGYFTGKRSAEDENGYPIIIDVSYPDIGFNAEYLKTILKQALDTGAETFTFGYGHENIQALQITADRNLFLLMPLRTVPINGEERPTPPQQDVSISAAPVAKKTSARVPKDIEALTLKILALGCGEQLRDYLKAVVELA